MKSSFWYEEVTTILVQGEILSINHNSMIGRHRLPMSFEWCNSSVTTHIVELLRIMKIESIFQCEILARNDKFRHNCYDN